jgi:hypothetical protein
MSIQERRYSMQNTTTIQTFVAIHHFLTTHHQTDRSTILANRNHGTTVQR